jgi:hypothetical protein
VTAQTRSQWSASTAVKSGTSSVNGLFITANNAYSHSKAECTNERVDRPFTGDCRVCGQPGHRGADCPDKPAEKCHLCDQEGHKAIDCTAKRTDAFKAANDMTDEEAWKAMKLADSNKDLDDFRKVSRTSSYQVNPATNLTLSGFPRILQVHVPDVR